MKYSAIQASVQPMTEWGSLGSSKVRLVSSKVRLVLASAISAGLVAFLIFLKRFSEAGSGRVHSEPKPGRARQVRKEVPMPQLTFKCHLRSQFLEQKLVLKSHVMNAVNIVREPALNPALT
jgi:hypothetical protein